MTEKYIIAKDEIAALLKGETFTLQPPLHNGVTAFQVEINEELLTNGDVIKALFPNIEFDFGSNGDCVHLKCKNAFGMLLHNPLWFVQIPTEWWNAPYKRGDGEC